MFLTLKNRLYQYVYVLSYIVFLASSVILLNSQFNNVYSAKSFLQWKIAGIVTLIVIFVQIVLLLTRRHGLKQWSVIGLMLIIFVLSYFLKLNVITSTLFLLFLFMANADLLSENAFATIDLATKLIILVVIFAFLIFHVFPSQNAISFTRGTSTRYAIGFTHPNVLSGFILSILCSALLLLQNIRKHFTYLIYALLLVVYLVIAYLTGSRGFMVAGAVLILGFGLSYSKRIVRWLPKVTWVIVSLTFVIGIGMVAWGSSLPLFNTLNNALSGRPGQQLTVIQYFYSPKIIGQNLPLLGARSNLWVDNTFLFILLSAGFIGLMLLLALFIGSAYKAKQDNNYFLCVILIALAVQGIIETQLTNAYMFAPFIYAFTQVVKDVPKRQRPVGRHARHVRTF
ncbi:O-antigen ligase family protein [Fructilactobacillus fructivorans]|uniref:O-antigen ligase family protein n=1 Tax=Fructilactobacillus fructivorans TaxID=1614 RepID=UPI0007049EA6|nr:hypothetical protein [Fructilactobacillus fructivorans]